MPKCCLQNGQPFCLGLYVIMLKSGDTDRKYGDIYIYCSQFAKVESFIGADEYVHCQRSHCDYLSIPVEGGHCPPSTGMLR